MTTPIPVILRAFQNTVNLESKEQLILDDPTVPGKYYIDVSDGKNLINTLHLLVNSNGAHVLYHSDQKGSRLGDLPICLYYNDTCEYKNNKITYKYNGGKIYVSSNVTIKNTIFTTILISSQCTTGTTPAIFCADYLLASKEGSPITIASPLSLLNKNGSESSTENSPSTKPIIISITSITGTVGDKIAISGANFTKNPTTSVIFGNINCSDVNVTSPTTLTCVVPKLKPGKYDVAVNNVYFQNSNTISFTYRE